MHLNFASVFFFTAFFALLLSRGVPKLHGNFSDEDFDEEEDDELLDWPSQLEDRKLAALDPKALGQNGLCVIGCTPYVDFSGPFYSKYRLMVREMANTCDVIVHVGDTIPGKTPCTEDVSSKAIRFLRGMARRKGKLALYTPGDNEVSDCHKHNVGNLKASDARAFLVQDLMLSSGKDLTNAYPVLSHFKEGTIPNTGQSYSCDFDKYVAVDGFAVATIEVLGSFYYLQDNRKVDSPLQDEVDPLSGRMAMHLNALNCAMDWIEESAQRANSNPNTPALFILLHGQFYGGEGSYAKGNNGIGDYYLNEQPYQPLFAKLTSVAKKYPNLKIWAIHADGHRTTSVRLNPSENNYVQLNGAKVFTSNHNLMAHMLEGNSRALTMFHRFTVDKFSFQPVSHKEEWSEAAFNGGSVVGHYWGIW